MGDITILKYRAGIREQFREGSSGQNLELVPKIDATIERKIDFLIINLAEMNQVYVMTARYK